MKFNEIIQSATPTLVDFHAEWCGPCHQFSPIIQEVKNELGDHLRVIKIDVDKNQTLAQRLNIMSIPTVVIYKSGKVVWRESGVQTKLVLLKKIKEIAAQ